MLARNIINNWFMVRVRLSSYGEQGRLLSPQEANRFDTSILHWVLSNLSRASTIL